MDMDCYDQAPAGSRNSITGFYQKNTGSLGISFSAQKFGQFHTFWRTYLFVKNISQTKVSPIPACGKQQERAGAQCCWQCGDPKQRLPPTRETKSLRYCQIQPWSVKRHGLLK